MAVACAAVLAAPLSRADPEATASLRGIVFELGTRRPVAGAEASVDGRPAAVTDDRGAFVVDSLPPGLHEVRVAAFWYEPLRASVTLTRSLEGRPFYLEPGLGALPEVEVVARVRREPSRQAMTRAELAAVPATAGDPLRAVTALPGVSAASDIDSNLYVRGGGPNDNAMYVDGIPAGYPYHFQGVASTFQADAIETLSFYSGGFPARFGNRTGGIFDLSTRSEVPDRFAGAFDVSLIASSLVVASPLPAPGLSVFAAGRRGYFDFVVPHGVRDTAVPRYDDYLVKVTLTGTGWGVATLEAFGADDTAVAQVRSRTDPSVQGEFDWRHAFHVAALRREPAGGGPGLSAVLAGTLSRQSVDLGQGYFFNESPESAYTRISGRLDAGAHRAAAGAEATVTRHRLDTYFARFPSEGQGTYSFSLLTKIRSTSRLMERQGGVWLSDRWEPNPGSWIEVGARADGDTRARRVTPAPRVAGRIAVARGLGVQAAGGLYLQPPQTLEVAPDWGNPHLASSRAWHGILGAVAERGGWVASVEAYVKRYDDLVTPDPAAIYANKGSGYARGAEVLVRRSFEERLAGWLGYAWAASRRRDAPGGDLRRSDYDLPHAVTAVGRGRLTKALTVSARWRWSTGLPYTPVTGQTADATGAAVPVFGAVNSRRLPAYHRLDLRAEYRVRFETWTLVPYLELLNAYDRRNLATVVWTSNYSGERRIRQLPRTLFFGLGATF